MAADTPPTSNEAWKQKYLEALDRHEREVKAWDNERDVLKKAVQRLTHAAASEDAELNKILGQVREVVRDQVDVAKLAKYVSSVADRVVQRNENPVSQGGDMDSTRICALLVSEMLYQLLERVSLPGELAERLGRLRQRVDEGVQSGVWSGIMIEVSDIAAEIRAKINQERLDTESFLRLITERLADLDGFFRNDLQARQVSREESLAFGRKVQEHVHGIASGMQQVGDIQALRTLISERMSEIQRHLEEFRRGEDQRNHGADAQIKTLNERLAHVEAEADELRERVVKARVEALVDALTGLPNRLAYDERMALEHARWRRFNTPLTLVVWDIDHFKQINDNYGHLAGDNALKSIAQLLAGKIRETDFIARYGGEEFVLVMPGATARDALLVAEKMRGVVEASHFMYRDVKVKITISCGVAEFHGHDQPTGVFARADKALYKAKQQGRNRCILA
ncbi:MAG: diguanylate cyclase [Pseudomonadota bacterium]